MKRTGLLAAALLLGLMSAGCVTRRVLITSEPTGAIVYRNGQPLGPTPVEEPFIYYGKYHYRLVHDGYEPTDFYPELIAPWYQYPGIDFVTENILPWPFRDNPPLHFKLNPIKPVLHPDIRTRATQLQDQAKTIQRPADAAPLPPRTRPVPQPAPPVLPPPQPVPGLPAPRPITSAESSRGSP